MFEQLKEQLRAIIADYNYESDIINDSDVDDFVNAIIEYDNANDGCVYDCLLDNCNVVNYDVISDIITHFDSVEQLSCFLSDLDDDSYDNYILDDYGNLKNITKEDLSDFIDDLDYAK